MRQLYTLGKLVSSLVLIGLSLACQQQRSPGPSDQRASDERAVWEADVAICKVAAAKNLEESLSFYADDASAFPPNTPMLTGKQSIRKWVSELMATPGFAMSWQPTKVETSRGGDLAYTVGTYQLTMNDPKGKPVADRGKYVTVWKKQPDGRWKMVADIFNSDLPAPGSSTR
jgi:ketosteroid isomerase-like protein